VSAQLHRFVLGLRSSAAAAAALRSCPEATFPAKRLCARARKAAAANESRAETGAAGGGGVCATGMARFDLAIVT